MEVIKLDEVKDFKDYEAEKIKFKRLFTNEYISISLDKYEAGIRTPMLYKDRPEGAKEILIPIEGRIKIITKNEARVFDPEKEGLSLVIIDRREERRFENVGDKEAKGLAIFAPPFHLKEIEHFLKKIKK